MSLKASEKSVKQALSPADKGRPEPLYRHAWRIVVRESLFGLQVWLIFFCCLSLSQMGKVWLQQQGMRLGLAPTQVFWADRLPSQKQANASFKTAQDSLTPATSPPVSAMPTALAASPLLSSRRQYANSQKRFPQHHRSFRRATKMARKPTSRASQTSVRSASQVKSDAAVHQIQRVLEEEYRVTANRTYTEYMGWVGKTLEQYQESPSPPPSGQP